MPLKCLTTASWCLGFTVLVCCTGFGQDANTGATAPLVQSTSPAAVTNSADNRTSSFELKPTAIAPAGAVGSAQIKQGSVSVHLSALGPGVYRLDVVCSDGLRKKLGTITIIDPTSSPSREATDNKKEASANPTSVRVETDASLTIPRALEAQDVRRILLMDRDNAVLDSQAK